MTETHFILSEVTVREVTACGIIMLAMGACVFILGLCKAASRHCIYEDCERCLGFGWFCAYCGKSDTCVCDRSVGEFTCNHCNGTGQHFYKGESK